ncbi:MAG: hypothetical protein QOE70_6416 [Chthoniobacter sp.]|jgi:hypothetical protein|nr:hypothetical protein [Chthoniobacter sp.]
MKTARLLLALCLAATATAHAQLNVDLEIKRRSFIAHEPIIATVTVSNLSGRDLTLADTPQMQWFGFQINGQGDRIVRPRNLNYGLDPLEIKSGGQMRRTVNLSELYEIGEFGIYRIRANIYSADQKKFYSSRSTAIEVTEGRLIWKQTVGVAGGGAERTYSLLAHQQGEYSMLYVRVEDRENGVVYCTHELGRLLEGQPPSQDFDLGNNLYVLQLTGQREYRLTKIGTNGEYLGQTKYAAPKSRPYLRKLADGNLQIVGGRREEPIAKNAADVPVKLSERPPGIPTN